MKKFDAIVLAAGKGSRMSLDNPKVMLDIGGKPVIYWSLSLLQDLGIKNINVVLLHDKKVIESYLNSQEFEINFIDQRIALGTGHAVKVALPNISSQNLLVLFGDDSGLYRTDTIRNFMEFHDKSDSKMTLLTLVQSRAKSIGGLKRDKTGNVVGVATRGELIKSGQKRIETVCGAFCFDTEWLKENIKKLKPSTLSGEYPLPGLIKIAASQGRYALSYELKSPDEWNSLNTPQEYEITKIKKTSY